MYDDLLGKKFAYHGRGPDEYDCLGLVIEVHRRHGIIIDDIQSSDNLEIIHTAIENHENVYETVKVPTLLTVGLFQLVPKYITHMGTFIDDYGNFIHIIENANVAIENINSVLWRNKIRGYIKWKN